MINQIINFNNKDDYENGILLYRILLYVQINFINLFGEHIKSEEREKDPGNYLQFVLSITYERIMSF